MDLSDLEILSVEKITSLLAESLESHFKLYPDARLWITELAYDVHQASVSRLVEWLDGDCDCPTNTKSLPGKRYRCWKCMLRLRGLVKQ